MIKTLRFPRQHGAWAYLLVPSIITASLGAGNLRGFLFLLTWLSAFPVSYFLTSACVIRMRRQKWTHRARQELQSAGPWALLTFLGSVLILQRSPWIFWESLLLVLLWSASVYLSVVGRERGITNDLLLVGLASTAPAFMYQIALDVDSFKMVPFKIWIVSLVSFLFFVGSVFHVKALIREAQSMRWHIFSILYHLVIAMVLAIIAPAISLTFIFATIRTMLMRPGIRPSRIGAVETILAGAFIVATVIAER